MASKQSEAKERQGYNPKPVPRQCSTCRRYTSEVEEYEGAFGVKYGREKNRRCGLGGFAVKKTACCDKYMT